MSKASLAVVNITEFEAAMEESAIAKCPKCGCHRFREWDRLTDDEKFIAERLPASADHTPKQRRRHRFCTRCWHESKDTAADA